MVSLKRSLKNILIFGDSNSWGYVDEDNGKRYESRWPIIFESNLNKVGIDCKIIEDALPGRTTNIDDGEDGKHNVQTFAISSANTWEKKVITFNGDTATALANDNSAELDFAIVLGAGSNYQTSSTNTWASGDKKSTSSQTQPYLRTHLKLKM